MIAAGNNVLAGGANGSVGDTVSYANANNPNSGAGVMVNLAITSAQSTTIAGIDTFTGFENVIGSAFDDTLTGTSGKNVLTGGGGNDTLTGGAGADTFVFNPDSGTDVITDFNPSQEFDSVQLVRRLLGRHDWCCDPTSRG